MYQTRGEYFKCIKNHTLGVNLTACRQKAHLDVNYGISNSIKLIMNFPLELVKVLFRGVALPPGGHYAHLHHHFSGSE